MIVATGSLLVIMRKTILRTIPNYGGEKAETWKAYYGVAGIVLLLDFLL